jgi:hypothetical protein
MLNDGSVAKQIKVAALIPAAKAGGNTITHSGVMSSASIVGKPVIGPDGKPVYAALAYSAGLGVLIPEQYIIKLLDSAGLRSSDPKATMRNQQRQH